MPDTKKGANVLLGFVSCTYGYLVMFSFANG